MALLGSGLQYLYAPNLPLQFPANPAAAAAAVISLAPSPVGINQLLTVPVPFPGFHLLTSPAPPQSACIPRNPSMPILPIDSARSMTSPQMCCVEAFDTNMINCRSPDVCSKPTLDDEPRNHRQLIGRSRLFCKLAIKVHTLSSGEKGEFERQWTSLLLFIPVSTLLDILYVNEWVWVHAFSL